MPDDAPPVPVLPAKPSADRDDSGKADHKPDETDASSVRRSDEHIPSVFDVLLPILRFINFLHDLFVEAPKSLANQVIFAGQFGELHQTKFTFTQINEQYKESLKTLDSAIWWGFGVIILSWYVFILLADKGTVTFMGLTLSQAAWLNVSPAIILAMQIFFVATLMRVMALRLGIGIVLEKVSSDELRKGEVGDTSNVNLSGFLGMIIMFLRLIFIFKGTKLALLFWISLALIVIIILAPQLTLWSIIAWLSLNGYYWSMIIYIILTTIISATSLYLLVVTAWLYSAAGLLTFSGRPPAAAAASGGRNGEGQKVASPPRRQRGQAAKAG